MSILYHTRINRLQAQILPLEQLVAMTYHSSEDNFRHRLREAPLDLSDEPAKIRTPRFVELLQKIRATHGLEAVRGLPFFHATRTPGDDWRALHDSYGGGGEPLQDYHALVQHNTYQVLTATPERQLPVLLVDLEVVSVHPDAGFPRYSRNPATTKANERRFLLRLLADSLRSVDPEHPLVREADKPTEYNPRQPDPALRMRPGRAVWGFERHRGTKIKPTSVKAFWKRHADAWWAELRHSHHTFAEKSDNQPYECVPYTAVLHPRWEADLRTVLEAEATSTAYWT